VNETSHFERKHYFYCDMPVGFQITQQVSPLASDGIVLLDSAGEAKRVRIARIQLEQDSGKSIHDVDPEHSLVDLNRAGVGLMEIVTEPDMSKPEEAVAFIKKVQHLLRHIGTSSGAMEEGALRADVNISVELHGDRAFKGERCEVKNLNSLRSVHRAIDFEVERQTAELVAGRQIPRETRSFDAAEGATRRLRSKEALVDYRFMPEPDLPQLRLSRAAVEAAAKAMPELPDALRARLEASYPYP